MGNYQFILFLEQIFKAVDNFFGGYLAAITFSFIIFMVIKHGFFNK